MKTNPKNSSVERVHHPFSPSTLQYREACAYFEPQAGENEAAAAGTRQHSALDTGDHELLSDQQVTIVEQCLEYFEALRSQYPEGKVITEKYLPIDDYRGTYKDWQGRIHPHLATTAGYLDRAIVSKDRRLAEVCDWKFGEWDAEPAENNVQGMAYLLGLYREIPTLEEVTVRFVMPYRDEISFYTFRRKEFQKLHQRIRAIVFRAVEAREARDFTKAVPSATCLFCANAGRCDALAAVALKIGHKFAPAEIPEDVTPSALHDPAQAAMGLRVAQIVGAWATAFRAQKTAQALESGLVPNGYQLVASSDRKIVDQKKLREICLQFGLTDEEVDSASRFYITTLDTIIRAKAPRGSKDLAVEAITFALLSSGALEKGPEIASLRMIKKSGP